MLTPRENQILRAIVNEYISSAQPVGSRLLWSRYGFGISPATIRGVMVTLTDAGFLEQPHTSAGRVPTDQAYRLFLEGAERSAPSLGEREKFSQRIRKAPTPEAASLVLAEQLAELSGSTGIHLGAGGPCLFRLTNIFGQPEFQDPRVAGYVAELLDRAAEWLPKLASEKGKLAIRIGAENEDWRARQVSVVAMKLGAKDYAAWVAVVGPTRLPYRKVASLLDYGRKEVVAAYG